MSEYKQSFETITGDKAREVMEAIIKKHHLGHLVLTGDDFPYVIPINHTYHNGELIVHCALKGKKIDMVGGGQKACYGIYGPENGITVYADGDVRTCQKNYESVICYGHVRLVEDLQERRKYLGLFARDYKHADLKHAEETSCNCLVLKITEMTARMAFHPKPKVLYRYVFEG